MEAEAQSGAAEVLLPEAVSKELLRRYSDIIRVGRLLVNGEVLTWETEVSTEMQFRNFCQTLFIRLSEVLPELARTNPAVLRFAIYWFCKSVSINYALVEVLLMIKQKVGVLCTLQTREALVEYGLEILPDSNVLRASLSWSKADNIVYLDPEHFEAGRDPEVKGTLSCLATEFNLPPDEDFRPEYCLHMRLKKSLAARFASRLSCGNVHDLKNETIFIDEPLRSHHPLETFAELTKWPLPAAAVAQCSQTSRSPRLDAGATSLAQPLLGTYDSPTSETSRDRGLMNAANAEDSPGHRQSRLESTSSEATTLWTFGEEAFPIAGAAILYQLRVRILRARIVPPELQSHTLHAADGNLKLYATCSLAGRTKRTRAVAASVEPEWLEAWCFPVKAEDLRSDIIIEVYDNGMYGSNEKLDFLGRATVPVSAALAYAGTTLTEPLCASNVRTGVIELELELMPAPGVEEESVQRPAGTHLSSDPQRPAGTNLSSGRQLRFRDNWDAAARHHEEECNVEVGSSLSLSRLRFGSIDSHSLLRPPVLSTAPLGISVKVRAAPPSAGGHGLWCTRACAVD